MELDILRVVKKLVSEGYSLKRHHNNPSWKCALENGEIVIQKLSDYNKSKVYSDDMKKEVYSDDMKKEVLMDYFKWHNEQGFISHKNTDIDYYIKSNK